MMNLSIELTTGPLAAEIAPSITTGNDAAIYDILHRADIPALKPIVTHDIQRYLMLSDLLLPIEESTADSCKKAARAMQLFESFDVRVPTILAKLTEILDTLVAEVLMPDFTATHKAYILALGNTLVSRADQLGYPISIQDIAQALRG